MTNNQDLKIKEIISDLDRNIPKDDAYIQFSIYGGGVDESKIRANKNGYLRLGVEFMKAAFVSPVNQGSSESGNIEIDIDYLIKEQSPIEFNLFERAEKNEPIKYNYSFFDRIFPLLIILSIVAITIFAVIGVYKLFF